MEYDAALVLDPAWQPTWELLGIHAPPVVRPVLHRFSGGEVHVQFPQALEGQSILLAHRLNTSDNLMELLLAADCVRGMTPLAAIDLFCPYIPYARQDRRMVPGDPLSIKVFAGLINAAGFRQVFVLDPHSDVSPALIDRCRVLPIDSFVSHALVECGADFVVIPDAGAAKKTYGLMQRLADMFPNVGTLQAGKHRDVQNRGKIVGMQLEGNPNLTGKTCLIVDDICDGGRTFLELSKLLRQHLAARVFLYVTHGIFAKGLAALLECSVEEGRLDGVFTTDSIRSSGEAAGLVQFSL